MLLPPGCAVRGNLPPLAGQEVDLGILAVYLRLGADEAAGTFDVDLITLDESDAHEPVDADPDGGHGSGNGPSCEPSDMLRIRGAPSSSSTTESMTFTSWVIAANRWKQGNIPGAGRGLAEREAHRVASRPAPWAQYLAAPGGHRSSCRAGKVWWVPISGCEPTPILPSAGT